MPLEAEVKENDLAPLNVNLIACPCLVAASTTGQRLVEEILETIRVADIIFELDIIIKYLSDSQECRAQ